MPELPEVETTKRGIEPYLVGRRIVDVVVRETRLRYPIPGSFKQDVIGRDIVRLVRRGKYIIVESDQGGLIFHLGMSGSLRIVGGDEIAKKHISVSHGLIGTTRGCKLWYSLRLQVQVASGPCGDRHIWEKHWASFSICAASAYPAVMGTWWNDNG